MDIRTLVKNAAQTLINDGEISPFETQLAGLGMNESAEVMAALTDAAACFADQYAKPNGEWERPKMQAAVDRIKRATKGRTINALGLVRCFLQCVADAVEAQLIQNAVAGVTFVPLVKSVRLERRMIRKPDGSETEGDYAVVHGYDGHNIASLEGPWLDVHHQLKAAADSATVWSGASASA